MNDGEADSGMTSHLKRLANAGNARRSTGPRTAEGKQRSSQNALRHGLAVCAGRDPVHTEEIEALARLIAGDSPDEATLYYARRVAEQCVELNRIAAVRVMVINNAYIDADEWAESDPALDVSVPIADATLVLLGLSRYERRALSGRKTALKAFQESQSGVPGASATE